MSKRPRPFTGGTTNLSTYLTKENQTPWRDDGPPFTVEVYEALQKQLVAVQSQSKNNAGSKKSCARVESGHGRASLPGLEAGLPQGVGETFTAPSQ